MKLFTIILLFIIQNQTIQSSSYTCNQDNFTIDFNLSSPSSFHTASNPITNCSLSQCNNNNNQNSCRSLQTPCFDYRSINNISYCAPASFCSILQPCNSNNTCSSNTSVCIVNSCCTLQTVCLPLLWTTLCTSSVISTTTNTMTTQASSVSVFLIIEWIVSDHFCLGSCQLSFAPMITYPVFLNPLGVAMGDFNNDNQTDLVVTNYGNNTFSLLLGYNNGSFKLAALYSTGLAPIEIAVGDFNGDNQSDVVVTSWYDNTISVFLGYGNGSFSAPSTCLTGNSPYSVVVGDFNNDHISDLVVTNVNSNSIGVYLGQGGKSDL